MRQVINFSKNIVFPSSIATICSISLEHEEKVYSGCIMGEFLITGDYKVHNDTTKSEEFKYRLPFNNEIADNINLDTISLDILNFTYETVDSDALKVDIEYVLEGTEEENKSYDEINFEAISDLEHREEEEENFDVSEILRELEEDLLDEPVSETREEENKANEANEVNTINIVDSNINITSEDNDNMIVKDNSLIIEDNDSSVIKDNNVLKEDSDNVIVKDNNIDNEVSDNVVVKDSDINVTSNNVKNDESTDKSDNNEYVTYHIHIMKDNELLENIVKTYNGNLDVVKELNDLKDIKVGSKVIIPEYSEE